jgi:nucleotidyltransferase/DNA polymerase involved in DNA repair
MNSVTLENNDVVNFENSGNMNNGLVMAYIPSEDIDDLDRATAELKPVAAKVWRYCGAQGTCGKTVIVKIKYSDFTQTTRSRTATVPFANVADVFDAVVGLLATVYPFRRSVRLLGVTLSSLTNIGPATQPRGGRNSISTFSARRVGEIKFTLPADIKRWRTEILPS